MHIGRVVLDSALNFLGGSEPHGGGPPIKSPYAQTSVPKISRADPISKARASRSASRCALVSSSVGTACVNLVIVPQEEAPLSHGTIKLKAIHYVVKVKIGGVAGLLAPVVGNRGSSRRCEMDLEALCARLFSDVQGRKSRSVTAKHPFGTPWVQRGSRDDAILGSF